MNAIQILTKVIDTLKYYMAEGIDLTLVPKAEQKKRIATCEACTDNFNSLTRQCSVCHCFMDVKTRLKFDPIESGLEQEKKITTCPDGKW